MKKCVVLCTSRDNYGINCLLSDTMTVGELIDELREYSRDLPIVFKNDGGYTYGYISSDRIGHDRYSDTDD